MKISPVSVFNNYPRSYISNKIEQNNPSNVSNTTNNDTPVSYSNYSKINFSGKFVDPNRKIPDIEYEEYMILRPASKERYRKAYREFARKVKPEKMADPSVIMPLKSEKTMDELINFAQTFNRYKDQPIICLGRGPKWVLNTSLWMKDGLKNYKYVAFSDFWLAPDFFAGGKLKEIPEKRPTEQEYERYKKYLTDIKADPASIVEKTNKTGKKTVITTHTIMGKKESSFLDLMAQFAKEQGVLEEFSKSIELANISSTPYIQNYLMNDSYVPEVKIPASLKKYEKNIKQNLHDIKDLNLYMEMFFNQNPRKCRSTFYPPKMWTVYRPDKFKTGVVDGDVEKIKQIIKLTRQQGTDNYFPPSMSDFRNLLNFRILDALSARDKLKAKN